MLTFGLFMTVLMIVGALSGILASVLAVFPINIEWGWAEIFFNYVDVVLYLIPVYDLWPLILLIFTIGIVRFVISLINVVMDLIPLT